MLPIVLFGDEPPLPEEIFGDDCTLPMPFAITFSLCRGAMSEREITVLPSAQRL